MSNLEKSFDRLALNNNLIESNNQNNIYNMSNATLGQIPKIKGALCSLSGNNYEKLIHSIVKNCTLNNKPFNSQKEEELAGSSSKNDIICNFNSTKDLGIEVKKYNTPDWMQCSVKYDKVNNKWIASNGKNSEQCRNIFNNILNKLNLYNGEIPPFMISSKTHEQWLEIKKSTNKWDDIYIDVPPNTIADLYKAKGCHYIQISDNYGLYHLNNDICNFGVPLFKVEQQLRIRTKIHSRKNKKGFCSLSITAACQPKNINELIPSNYTLDCKERLPNNLIYIT